MRLLNTRNLEFTEFYDASEERYAILSHRWLEDEVSFKEFKKLSPETTQKYGYQKILNAARVADDDGYSYIWIDTCCIDKRSSAELSESINSMFKWYQNSDICYAYLSDVWNEGDLESSRWFNRGWTLQELIAPSHVVFLSQSWEELGTKKDMASRVSNITGIPRMVLIDGLRKRDASIAQIMSWAAKRKTSRVEDIEYCLLGLFDVNIPLLYGEGDKAFHRLQEHIIARTHDNSILAWEPFTGPEYDDWDRFDRTDFTIFARSPDRFQNSRDVYLCHTGSDPIAVTNVGLSLTLRMRAIDNIPPGFTRNQWTSRPVYEVALGTLEYYKPEWGSWLPTKETLIYFLQRPPSSDDITFQRWPTKPIRRNIEDEQGWEITKVIIQDGS